MSEQKANPVSPIIAEFGLRDSFRDTTHVCHIRGRASTRRKGTMTFRGYDNVDIDVEESKFSTIQYLKL
jgi:hypothetical protein